VEANLVLLPGDGIGPEVVAEGRRVLESVMERFGHRFLFKEYLIGGIAIDRTGVPLPVPTLHACLRADAVLLGAVGGPKWDDPQASVQPERGLLDLRRALRVYANLRPVKVYPSLEEISPVRRERLQDVDIVIVRELTGGLYFGQPRVRDRLKGQRRAVDTLEYTEDEIARVVRLAFTLARSRRKKVVSVDKANVLESSRLWRQIASEVAKEFPDVSLEHQLVDSAAMRLVASPASFDVLVMENMFGDILSDEASVLAGSLGMLPSASLGEGAPGLFEPVHGSAPDIAGKGIANPVGAIASAAMLLRYGLGQAEAADRVDRAVAEVLSAGARTPDIARPGEPTVGTREIGQRVARLVLEGRAMAGR